MSEFWTRTWTKMPRHVAGLLGVGAAFVCSIYFSMLIAELIMDRFFVGGTASLTSSLLAFLKAPTPNDAILVSIFLVCWVFIGAPAFAGAYRYLIGTIDPKHIAQRAFVNGIKFYTGRMLPFTIFMSFMVAVLLAALYLVIIYVKPETLLGHALTNLSLFVGLMIALMLFTKLAYLPPFLISGEGLGSSIKKSWVATKRRFWTIFGYRAIVLIISLLPILIRVLFRGTIELPSVSLWPYLTLMIVGFEEFIAMRGFQEWEEEKNLPIISPKFFEKDVKQLEDYSKYMEYDDHRGSMEF